MLPVLALMAAAWWGGGWLQWSRRLRLALVALLWAAWLAALWWLPGHTLRELVEWALLAPLVLAAAAYGRWLGTLRRRASAPPVASAVSDRLDDAELARYSRHILLHEIGGAGQRRLKAARVLVVGVGGLGSPVLQYLAAAGVGTLGFIDDDVIEASNLHRQVIHAEAAIGRPKVFSAVDALSAQNPHVRLRPYHRKLTAENAEALFADYDLILDGSDSFDTRELVNRAAVRLGKPLIAGAMTQWEGQLTVYDPARGAPCYACVFPERPAPGTVAPCSVAGVAGPLPGVIGAMMALEAVKEITGAGESLRGRLLIWDGLSGDERIIRIRRRPGCPVCGTAQPATAGAVQVAPEPA